MSQSFSSASKTAPPRAVMLLVAHGLPPFSYRRLLPPFFLPPGDGTGQAGNGTRTRDPNLGKVVLYQLSYSRNLQYEATPLIHIDSAQPIPLPPSLTALFYRPFSYPPSITALFYRPCQWRRGVSNP